ncbi:radical SAM protein [Methanoculleus sp.]|uniref:SPL family radical SAM protein n=1 Tax=Methanoculleus sp. TaxID=90427 RepID=UPI00261D5227|nr:radical SAM protein [Methanoculleus sp.]MDI6720658.1 radical SAM protein [Methanomicrobiales archaeon]MDI6867711.1 radical SAM protein [Methanoculleus sp.]
MKTTIIYEPRGRAKEYSELAANLYRGCGHRCLYCYAPRAIRVDWDEFSQPCVRKNIIERLERDARILAQYNEKRPILLSFTTDPYQPLDVEVQLTRKAIQILHRYNLKVFILTKGGSRAERDFDLLAERPELSAFGVSLVFSDEGMRREMEPFAANTEERIVSLQKAHGMGIYTYVSLEPVWDPDQSLELIERTHDVVDYFKVGKLNHNERQDRIDWSKFLKDVIKRLNYYEKPFYIKKDLQAYT